MVRCPAKEADTDTQTVTDTMQKMKEDDTMKKVRSKKLLVARNMPPLYHTIPKQSFDITQSEVLKWLVAQPEILNYIWDNIKNSNDVYYDSNTGKWQGIDFEGDAE